MKRFRIVALDVEDLGAGWDGAVQPYPLAIELKVPGQGHWYWYPGVLDSGKRWLPSADDPEPPYAPGSILSLGFGTPNTSIESLQPHEVRDLPKVHEQLRLFRYEKLHIWYQVFDDARDGLPKTISLRRFLGRGGAGTYSDEAWNNAVAGLSLDRSRETISLRTVKAFHAGQDRRPPTRSTRAWLRSHCLPGSQASTVPVRDLPVPPNLITEVFIKGHNWDPLYSEDSVVMRGLQGWSRRTGEDNPTSHKTMDWVWDQYPDPSFSYLLSWTGKYQEAADQQISFSHNEWETGSFPINFRPFEGEYVRTEGRWIADIGHLPMRAEIHPAHTLVRQRTTARQFDVPGPRVPVTRTVVGMGMCGGFPGYATARWKAEFPGEFAVLERLPPILFEGLVKRCWPTDLRKHPLRFEVHPPTRRPSDDARLRWRILLAEWIPLESTDALLQFLVLCQANDPAHGGSDFGFRGWSSSQGLPEGFVPQPLPAEMQPQVQVHHDGPGRDLYLDVTIDTSRAPALAAGVHVLLDVGWDRQSPGVAIRGYQVTFESLTCVDKRDVDGGDWHVYYGVNGEWRAWFTEDAVENGESYADMANFPIVVWLVDDQPLVIRDAGVEFEGVDWGEDSPLGTFGNDRLSRLVLDLAGPNPLASLDALMGSANNLGLKLLGAEYDPTGAEVQWIRFEAPAVMLHEEDDPITHFWTLRIDRIP